MGRQKKLTVERALRLRDVYTEHLVKDAVIRGLPSYLQGLFNWDIFVRDLDKIFEQSMKDLPSDLRKVLGDEKARAVLEHLRAEIK